MRILFLAQRVPYPPDRGDKIPTYHYVRHLAREHEVHVACLAHGRQDLVNAEGLRSIVDSVDAVLLSPTRARVRSLSALRGERPLTVAYFDEPRLHDCIERRIKSDRIDVIIVFSSGMAHYVEKYDNLPRVIQLADLDSQKWKQYSHSAGATKSWLYRTESKRMLQYEKQIAGTFSRTLVCSPRELDDFQRLIPDAFVQCLPNGVDLDYFKADSRRHTEPDSLIFTGVMNYEPNVDGVTWFCRDILPAIRMQRPDVKFTICGSSPDRRVRKLARLPGVIVTGAVPDVRPYIAKSTVAVVPLRMARGIQNKVLEAMAMSVPVVATSAAWAGIEAEAGRELFVADDPTEFAAKTVELLQAPALQRQIGQAGRAAVENKYNWSRTLTQLDEIIASATRKDQSSHRQRQLLNLSSGNKCY